MSNPRAFQAVALAELQYNSASAICLPAARRNLIAATKVSILATKTINCGLHVPDDTWTTEELEAANHALREKNLQPIAKDDTAVWDLMKCWGIPFMAFYATPACPWIPAIAAAAATRVKAIEAKIGRAEARDLFKPPFMVIVSGHSSISIIMIPELVRDLQPTEYLLGPVSAEE